MNLTLSADKETIRRAREVARQQGTSLNALVRLYLRSLAERSNSGDEVEELFRLMDEGGGDLGGRDWSRDEVHER
jgi:hypothetical protein